MKLDWVGRAGSEDVGNKNSPCSFPQHVGLADPLASGQESVFHITNAEVTVGRGAQCEWRMSKRLTWISNRHFTLGRDATGNVYIRDHSSNGTTVSLPSLPRRHHLSNAA